MAVVWQDDVFLADRYEITVEIWPVPTQAARVRHKAKEWVVPRCDNFARVVQRVMFSDHNPRQEFFTLRYSTRGRGVLTPPVLTGGRNEAPPADLERYDDHGKELCFSFTPRAGATYTVSFEVYGGFDPGTEMYTSTCTGTRGTRWSFSISICAATSTRGIRSRKGRSCIFTRKTPRTMTCAASAGWDTSRGHTALSGDVGSGKSCA